jgi:predicted ATP-dependent protease
MIPQANVRNLMLKDEVIDAVKAGKFHVWAVATIDEGIERLTGVGAGERLEDGGYTKGSVHGLVDTRLRGMAEALREFAGPEGIPSPVLVTP